MSLALQCARLLSENLFCLTISALDFALLVDNKDTVRGLSENTGDEFFVFTCLAHTVITSEALRCLALSAIFLQVVFVKNFGRRRLGK